MAKAKETATEKFVETLQDNDFADPEPEQLPARGSDLQGEMNAIRVARAAERARRGPNRRRREVTNYHDAERLTNLAKAGHTHLATPEEMVDWEEAGLLPNHDHFYNNQTESTAAPQGSIVPPAPRDDSEAV
ncbi:hypothetical protein [Mycobacterium sp.]|uniref:hypothetical protein n=1 Tax=Mycobacterium sp. TaxID=1785 RepID=UPI00262E0B42|nr:hypothetical protein [Mycobacterium sp.]